MMSEANNNSILIADDMPRVAMTVEFLFRQRGFKVYRACNGREALKLAQTHRPKLILLDIMMPEMDGYQACSEIQLISMEYEPTIWFLTGRGSEWDRSQAEALSVNKVITKPFDPDSLVSDVQSFFNKKPSYIKDDGVK